MSSRPKRKKGRRKGGIMGASHIPYTQRIAMKQHGDIVINRDRAARIAMLCVSVAMNELEGIGYKRLVRFSLRFKDVVDEFYEDPEMGMAHAVQRMEQIGMPISGDYYTCNVEGATKRRQQICDHAVQAVQIALICGAIAMNDEFGFAGERQTRISERIAELSDRCAVEGEKFLLAKMEKIGFLIVDGQVRAFLDDENKAVTPARARKEGISDGQT